MSYSLQIKGGAQLPSVPASSAKEVVKAHIPPGHLAWVEEPGCTSTFQVDTRGRIRLLVEDRTGRLYA